MKNKELGEDLVSEIEGANTSIVNVAEIVNKKNSSMPETVVEELKYTGEEYGGRSTK